MVRPRWVKNPRTISVIVDGEAFDRFVEQLPGRKGASETIRELIDGYLRERDREKNAYSQNYDLSAIKAINNKLSDDFNLSQQQKTLDFFNIERQEIPELIETIADKSELGFMQGHCKEFLKYSRRKMEAL